MKTTMNLTALAGLVAVAAIAPTAQADIVVPPPGEDGPYRIAFVTSATPGAVAQNMTALNAWVTGLAEAVTELDDLGTTWSVIGATTDVDVLTNTGMTLTGGVPIYLVDGTLFATDYAKFWSIDITSVPKTPPGDQDYTLYVDELGDPHGDPVQTGLTTNGSDTNPMTFAGHELDSTGGEIVHGGADSGYNNATYPWYSGASGDIWSGNWGDTRLFAISGVIGGGGGAEPLLITGTSYAGPGNDFIINFTGAADTTYNVEESADLQDFTPLAGVTALTDGIGVGTATVPAADVGSGKDFFRIAEIPE